jgi:hypothetical protein
MMPLGAQDLRSNITGVILPGQAYTANFTRPWLLLGFSDVDAAMRSYDHHTVCPDRLCDAQLAAHYAEQVGHLYPPLVLDLNAVTHHQ